MEEDIASRCKPPIYRHDLAFLRALVEGVPLPSATLRYLPSITLRSARRHVIGLLDTAIAMLRGMEQNEIEAALSAWRTAQSVFAQSESAKGPDPSVRGLDQAQVRHIVKALDFILAFGVSSPRLSDELSLWLRPSLYERLRPIGISRVANLGSSQKTENKAR